MSRYFYSFLFYLAVPFVLLRLLWRSRKEPEYRQDILQRFGFYRSSTPGNIIWIHAVSAGETIAAVPLVQRLVDQGYRCLITNMTPTGRDRVRSLLGDRVENCYAPYDLPGSVYRFLAANRPRMLIIVDTELWPNTLGACRRRNTPAFLVNGRMSARSARGYSRIQSLSQPMFSGLSGLAVQTEQHRQRFIDLGAAPEVVQVTGSIKFDAYESGDIAHRIERARELIQGRPVLLGASTHEGEESPLIEAFLSARREQAELLLVLAPRHTHRAEQVAGYCSAAGLTVSRFSETQSLSETSDVLLIDVMGELEAFYHVAIVALVGGSLVPVGGHNLLEGIRAGCVVLMGPHLYNIDDIVRQFKEAGGMIVTQDAHDLIRQVARLLSDRAARDRINAAANNVLEANRGSLNRIEALISVQLTREPVSL